MCNICNLIMIFPAKQLYKMFDYNRMLASKNIDRNNYCKIFCKLRLLRYFLFLSEFFFLIFFFINFYLNYHKYCIFYV